MQAVAPFGAVDPRPDTRPTLASCYAAHGQSVFRLGLRYGAGNVAWAEDLTHDVFIKLAENLSRLDDLDDLGGWLYRVTANLAVSRLRRETSLWGRVSAALRHRSGSTPGPAVAFEARDSAHRVLETLARLPARERVAVVMKVLDGHSQREIADALSLSEGYVSKLLARALQTIRAEHWEPGDGEA